MPIYEQSASYMDVDLGVLVPLCIQGYSSLQKGQEEATREFAAGQGVFHVGHASLPELTVICHPGSDPFI